MNPHSEIIDDLHTLRDWLRYAASAFARAGLYFGHGTDNAWDEAAAMMVSTLCLQGDKLAQAADARLIQSEKRQILELIETRINTRKPMAYLTGEAFFAGLKFYVDDQVLVPRSPIAELIERGFEPWLSVPPDNILDLCTGSGCIGIACAYAFPEAEVALADISSKALEVARRNIALHELDSRVSAIESDLFASLSGQYDLIVCNPPYVDALDMAELPPEYRNEPVLALASGEDGLDFTRRLLAEVGDYLTSDGVLVVEVGNSWVALENLYPTVPFTWLELALGGQGLFALTKAQIDQHQQALRSHYVG